MKNAYTKHAFQTVSGLRILECDDIFLFRFRENGWQMTLADCSTYILRTHTTAEKLLSASPRFLQIRHDCILNLDYLVFIENKTLRCIFRSPFENTEIFISRRYYTRVREQLQLI